MFLERLPVTRDERWGLLAEFLAAWFPEPPTAAGVSPAELDEAERRLGLSLPRALREWYERFGARSDVWCLQDQLWMPARIQLENGAVTFCIENQAVVRWGIRTDDLGDEDPPVVVSDPAGTESWLVEAESTSAFAFQFAVFNAKWSGAIRHGANGQGTSQAYQVIERTYPRLPFPNMHWPTYPTRFYGRDDIIIEAEAESWIWVTARTAGALDEACALLRATGVTLEDTTAE